jgi:NAD(P)-dependent dehydrogenase (short-subunit alcohol dehydrogenase family)
VSFFVRYFVAPPSLSRLEPLERALRGKTVLITGSSFGIGEATALLLARAGAEVILLARTEEKLKALVAQISSQGGRAHAYPMDLSNVTEVRVQMKRLEALHPRIDLIICNAGKSIRRSIEDSFERDDLERCLALNFASPALLLMALLPRMIEQGGGRVISVATSSAKLPGAPRWAAYQSSKAGFDVWLRSVAAELRLQRVLISSVYMPLVRTRMSTASPVFDRVPALTPELSAQVIAYAAITGADRVAPWWLWWAEWLSIWFLTPINRILTARYAAKERRSKLER